MIYEQRTHANFTTACYCFIHFTSRVLVYHVLIGCTPGRTQTPQPGLGSRGQPPSFRLLYSELDASAAETCSLKQSRGEVL